jgi:hypothetical protein
MWEQREQFGRARVYAELMDVWDWEHNDPVYVNPASQRGRTVSDTSC